MMKRISILLAMLVIMSIPISASAQATEFQVTTSSVSHNVDGFDVALTVNWHSVAVVLKINDEFYSEDWTDGPDNTYLFFWFKYEHLGVDAGETGELAIELSNATRVCMEDDRLLERPESIITIGFNVPFPEPDKYAIYEPPHDYDESPDFGLESLPFDRVVDFISHNPLPILIFVFGIFLVTLGIALEQDPEKDEKNKLELADGVKSLCDWDGGVGEEYSDRYYAIKMSKIDMPNTYPYPEKTMVFPDEETHKPYVTGQLPDISSPDDDGDWRTCPWCGTWTHGEKTRCIYCDGRLGRPLAR